MTTTEASGALSNDTARDLRALLDAGESGLYRLVARPAHERLARLADAAGFAYLHLDAEGAADKDAFLAAVSRAFDFPDYFGSNWDALLDCLTDLSWRAASGYLIFIEGLQTLAENAPREFGTALEILDDAARTWSEQGVPCVVAIADFPHPRLARIAACSAED